MPIKDTVELLGTETPLEKKRGKATKKAKDRKDKVLKRAAPLKKAPLRAQDKEVLARGGILPIATYAASVSTKIDPMEMRKMRREVLKGIFSGLTGTKGCAEVGFVVLTKGHLTDPAQAMDYAALRELRRLTTQNPRAREALRKAWAATGNHGGSKGPLENAKEVVKSLGWTWDSLHSLQAGAKKGPLWGSGETPEEARRRVLRS